MHFCIKKKRKEKNFLTITPGPCIYVGQSDDFLASENWIEVGPNFTQLLKGHFKGLYDIDYMWNQKKKCGTIKPTYKIEIESQM